MNREEFCVKNQKEIERLLNMAMNSGYVYRYFYLLSQHEMVKNGAGGVNLSIGSSYSTYGLNSKRFSGGLANLSIESQDMYYSYMHLKKAVENSLSPFERCFIVVGYYTFYEEMSTYEFESAVLGREIEDKIINGTEPEEKLWEDVRETFTDSFEADIVIDEIRNFIMNFFGQRRSFFNDMKKRTVENFEWNGATWVNIPDDAKPFFAKQRAERHNKFFGYKQSYSVNTYIFDEMIDFLKNNNIKPIIVIPPFTKQYRDLILPELKAMPLEMVKKAGLSEEENFFDANTLNIWQVDDFLDTDHLTEKGADVFSAILSMKFC